MAAQSIANRPSRHRAADDDVLLARALQWSHWARRNLRAVIAILVVAAVAVGGLLYYRIYHAQRAARAATEFMQLQRTVNPANPALAARDLEQFSRKYDGTTPAAEAQVLLAQMYLQQNQAAKAVAALGGAEDRIGDTPLGAQAALLLAAAKNAAGDTTGAIATYMKVADAAKLDFRRAAALENAAALRAQGGDFAGAAQLYQRLVDMSEPDSQDRQLYEMRLAEAQARAAAK
jgi:predicted negative regulator of RcsB-dependent stress response